MNAVLERNDLLPFAFEELRRWSVADYQMFIDHGILTEEDKVELLEGEVVNKMPANPMHDWAVMILVRLFFKRLPDDYLLRSQSGVQLEGAGRPEPDMAVLRWDARTFQPFHPGPNDVALVTEVSDSSLEQDRVQKGRIYSQAGIPVYWVVNLIESQIEVYTQPGEDAYRSRKDYPRGQAVPVEFDGKNFGTIPSEEVLPEVTPAT